MTSPLRNAARALCKAQSGVECFDDIEPEAQEIAIETVKAVILAIREPSEGMVIAGGQLLMDDDSPEPPLLLAEAVLQAMIDAALSEQP